MKKKILSVFLSMLLLVSAATASAARCSHEKRYATTERDHHEYAAVRHTTTITTYCSRCNAALSTATYGTNDGFNKTEPRPVQTICSGHNGPRNTHTITRTCECGHRAAQVYVCQGTPCHLPA